MKLTNSKIEREGGLKTKGFTLIELLAVIIILAVVALIATPIILNVIDDARTSAAESEANLVLKGINSYCEQVEMKKELGELDEGDIDCKEITTLSSEQLSKMVSNLDDGTTVSASLTNGKVSSLTVNSNTKEVVYNTTTGKMEVQDSEATEEPEEIAYYAFGLPTTSSSTNYQDVITSSGSDVFVKLQDEQLSVCIYINDILECFKNNNIEEESVHVQNVFGVDNCYVSDYTQGYTDDFTINIFPDGTVLGYGFGGLSCYLSAAGVVECC